MIWQNKVQQTVNKMLGTNPNVDRPPTYFIYTYLNLFEFDRVKKLNYADEKSAMKIILRI